MKPTPPTSDMRLSEDDDPALERAFKLHRLPDFYPFRISVPTAHRYCTVGVRGVVLKSMVIGGARVCTIDWLQDFLTQLNTARRTVSTRTPSARARARRRAEKELDKAGL